MEAVIAYVAGGFQAIGFSLATATTLATYTVGVIVSYGINYVAMQLGVYDQEQAGQAFDSGIKANKISPVAPIPVVYGRRTVGGAIVFRDLVNETKDLYQAMVISEGEIEDVEVVYINNVPTSTSIPLYDALDPRSDDQYTYTATHKIASDESLLKQIQSTQELVSFELKKGAEGQEASVLLGASPLYTDNHRGFKVAYLAIKIGFDRDVFPSGIPTVTCDVKGVKVYDPRDGSTAWSDNPSLCLLDYLTNDIYGCSIPIETLDLDSFITEANFCDELVDVKNSQGVTVQQKRYTCNGVVNTDDTCFKNMNKILTSMRGMLVFTAGKYKLKIDKQQTSTFSFTESNILGDWSITGGSKRMVCNRVVTRYFDAYNNFIESLDTVTDQSFLDADSGFKHEQQLSLHFVSQQQRAGILGQMHLKQSRQAWGVSFSSDLTGIQTEVGDVVDISNSLAGWDQKPFRIVSIELTDQDQVNLTCVEYDQSVYTYDLLTPPSQPDTNLNSGFRPSEPLNFVVQSGTDHLLLNKDGSIVTRAFLDWQTPINGFIASYEVGYKLSSQDDSQWTNFTTPVTDHYIQPVSDNQKYDFRVRAIGNQGGAGDYVYQENVLIVGKTEPPADVLNFVFENDKYYQQVFRWQEILDLDKDGYYIRYSTTTTTWEDMLPLHNGVIKTNPYETHLLPEGTYNFAIKAVDTTGNQSTNATVISGTVADDPNLTIFLSEFPHLLGWTGGKFDCYVNGVNELIPEDKKAWSTFSSDGTEWSEWTSWTRDPFELRYYHQIDLGADVTFTPRVTGVADGTLDLKIGIAKDGSSDVYNSSTSTFDQKFYPSGVTVTYEGGTTESFGLYLEMADNNYLGGDGRVASSNPDFGAKYHTLDGTPTWTSLDTGASPDAHIYYIEDLGAGNNDSYWSSILDQSTNGAWIIEDLTAGGTFYYKTNYSQSIPPSGIQWTRLSNGSSSNISLAFNNGFPNVVVPSNLYTPNFSSLQVVTGRYLSILATVTGGNNILKSLDILLDGIILEESKKISDTPSHSTQATFSFTTGIDFTRILSVQITPDQQFVMAQVTSVDESTNTISVAYEKSNGSFSGDVSFYAHVKGY